MRQPYPLFASLRRLTKYVSKLPIIMLEVCLDSLESAVNAIQGGADELEVCTSLVQGGLTPSAGLVKEIIRKANNISHRPRPKVNAMIRSRGGSDFCYSKEEMDTMLADLDILKEYGVDRFVFGSLTNNQEIDEENCSKVLARARPIPVTFHRAFDVCKDPNVAMKKIITIGFDRVLTSGQRPSAGDVVAVKLIKTLVDSYGDKIQIMPGAGINAENAKSFIDLGCGIVHSSCKRIRILSHVGNNVNMGAADSEFVYISDEETVKKTKLAISS